MNDLQIFSNPEFDGATALGYKNPRKALADHIDPEDKGVTKRDTPGGEQELLKVLKKL